MSVLSESRASSFYKFWIIQFLHGFNSQGVSGSHASDELEQIWVTQKTERLLAYLVAGVGDDDGEYPCLLCDVKKFHDDTGISRAR